MTENVKTPDQGLLVELTSEIVSAYVGNHVVPASDLPNLIAEVFGALSNTSSPTPVAAVVEKPKPLFPSAVRCRTIRSHVWNAAARFKSLKRHLMTHHNSRPNSIAKSGISPPTIRWSHRLTRRPARALPRNGSRPEPQGSRPLRIAQAAQQAPRGVAIAAWDDENGAWTRF